jgi:hypothetical protein
MTRLADQLEREPEYRGGTTHTRVSIGKTLLGPKLQWNERGYMTTLILQESSRLVRDNAFAGPRSRNFPGNEQTGCKGFRIAHHSHSGRDMADTA